MADKIGNIPKYFEKDLPNGLKIVVVPLNNNSGVINTDIFYRVGSRDEVMGKTGIAHMLEHLNFKSTKHLQAGEFDKIVKGFGGINNASTSFDITHYYIKSSTENLEKSLHLFAELMENLTLKNSEFQAERKVVLEERYWRTDNSPFGLLYFALYNTAFVYHPYHWTPIGFAEDIKSWKLSDIRAFHKRYYQPQNAIVVIAGDIDKDRAFQAVEKEFGHIQNRTKTIPRNKFIEPPQFGERRVILNRDTEVEYLAIGLKIPNFQSEDQIVLSVISSILSNGKSSRLYRKLITKKNIVNRIYAYNMKSIDENLFTIMAIVNSNSNVEEVERAIWKELKRLQKDEVDMEELEKVKTNIRYEFITGFQTSSATATTFGSYFAKGDITPLLKFEERVEKITPQDIIRVAKKYFVKNNATVVIYRK